MQLQGLASSKLPELTVGQGELVPLKLQRHRGLWLCDSTWWAREGSELGNLDNLPTWGKAEERVMGKCVRAAARFWYRNAAEVLPTTQETVTQKRTTLTNRGL